MRLFPQKTRQPVFVAAFAPRYSRDDQGISEGEPGVRPSHVTDVRHVEHVCDVLAGSAFAVIHATNVQGKHQNPGIARAIGGALRLQPKVSSSLDGLPRPKLILILDTAFGHDLNGIARKNLVDWLMEP